MKYFISLLIFFLLATTFNVFAQEDSVKHLSPVEFNRILKLNPNVVLLDVRPKKEFKKGHIKGALLAENSKELYRLVDSYGKLKVYLLYCECGERSVDAGKMIYDKYKVTTCSLEGGLRNWLESGFGF